MTVASTPVLIPYSIYSMECLSAVWMELSMVLVAGIIYLMLSHRNEKPAVPRACQILPPTVNRTKQVHNQEQTANQLVSKALRQGRVKEAVTLLRQLPKTQTGRVPANMAFRLLAAVSKTAKFDEAVPELMPLKCKFSSGPLEAAMAEALKDANTEACRRLHLMSNVLLIPKSHSTFQSLASAYSSDAVALNKLVQEAPTPLPIEFAKVVLGACKVSRNADLAGDVLARLTSSDAAVLRESANSVSHLHAKQDCLTDGSSTTPAGSSEKSSSNCSSPRSMPAGSAGDVAAPDAKEPHANLPRDIAMRANDIRSCGRNGDLTGALKVFERLDRQKADSTLIINSVIDACVACKDLDKAVDYFNRAKQREIADTVTYNTLIKGYLANKQEDAATDILEELVEKGLTATRPSFHGLLNARISAGDTRGAWRLVSSMQLSEVSPNAVTCSILLKGKAQSPADISKVLALIDAMNEPMDEVLFLAVIEACIRTKRLDLLSRQMDKFMRQSCSSGLTAHTYGSMIKAFGQAHNVKQVWSLWEHMLGHHVHATSVTLGCMVEALVANGCASDAWKLARTMWNDQSTRALVNTVVYSIILKGFASAKETEKVIALYQEMRTHQIQPNTITYNTIFNAFAQNGQMQRVPALLQEMRAAKPSVSPDIVTYSTIVKGFCYCGQLDSALAVVKDMKAEGKCQPDEVMYNSLLNGCAQAFRPDEALQVLSDMKTSNTPPSNYTLSMLVKLMGRCKRISEAFTMLEDISSEYGLKINIQVYTCLIQGCFNNGHVDKALAVHDKIINEGLLPDAMTYSVLVRGCIQAGAVDSAVDLARCAYGHGSLKSAPPGLHAGCLDAVVAALGGETSERGKTLTAELGNCPVVDGGPQPRDGARTSEKA